MTIFYDFDILMDNLINISKIKVATVSAVRVCALTRLHSIKWVSEIPRAHSTFTKSVRRCVALTTIRQFHR